jgi:quercetin dioxygenase-like cupin family protein
MSDIWVRYNDIKNLGEKFNDEHDSVWYPVAKRIPEVFPIVFGIMSAVSGERLGGVLITKLPPGGKIERHTDHGWHARYYDKYYVGIQTGGVFGFEDGDIRSNEGDVYWFDNSIPHWVINDSDKDRVSLIVCIKRFQC